MSDAAFTRLSAPWPIYAIQRGMIHMGASMQTFYVAVPRVY